MAETRQVTYTTKQAMECLGIKSTRAFHHLQKAHPEAFVLVSSKHFEKAPIDKFADRRNQLRSLLK